MTARPIGELYKGMNEEDLRIIEKGKELLRMEVALLSELRKDHDLTQKELADIMEIRQSAISQIEHQEDILVKTLERYVRALGGELEVRAKFPDKIVTLRQFTSQRCRRSPVSLTSTLKVISEFRTLSSRARERQSMVPSHRRRHPCATCYPKGSMDAC